MKSSKYISTQIAIIPKNFEFGKVFVSINLISVPINFQPGKIVVKSKSMNILIAHYVYVFRPKASNIL